MEEYVSKTLEALRRNRMVAEYVDSRWDVLPKILEWIPQGATIAFGGSVTLEETGVLNGIRQMGAQGELEVLDRFAPGQTSEELKDLFRRAFTSDVFLTSSNAVTQDGYLYNVDGRGNRVAAMIYGPDTVIVVAGINKICENLEAAIRRNQTVSAPKNAARLHKNTPCVHTGECMHCLSKDRICASFVVLGPQMIPNRIKVLLVGESLGY